MKFVLAILTVCALIVVAVLSACGEEGGGIYCCTYESRHTACGGGDWTAWESEAYQFDIDDYLEDWTPERVCDKFAGSDTECSATCCINVEYQNNNLSGGECS
jgi:hypothetical protein